MKKESVAAEGGCWRQAKVGSTFKFADEGRKRKAGAAQTPFPPAQLSAGAVPLATPGLVYPGGETPGRARGAHLLRD